MRQITVVGNDDVPSNIRDLRGLTTGRLTVVAYGERRRCGDRWYHYWKCDCLCGNTHVTAGRLITSGTVLSCGCILREFQRSGDARRTHGMKDKSEYNIWCGMKQRCHNPNSDSYKDYGGRGISVCDEWRASFEKFFEDIGPRPSSDHRLERIQNDGNYEPGNCRWATTVEQANNKKNNRMITYNDRTLSVAQWARLTGIPSNIIRKRIDLYGWTDSRALSTKVRISRKFIPPV